MKQLRATSRREKRLSTKQWRCCCFKERMRLLIVTVLWYLLVAIADARIGETPIQFADRYGAPKDSSLTKISDSQSPLIAGAIHHTYEYQGWKIRAAFLQLDGPAVRMDYQRSLPWE